MTHKSSNANRRRTRILVPVLATIVALLTVGLVPTTVSATPGASKAKSKAKSCKKRATARPRCKRPARPPTNPGSPAAINPGTNTPVDPQIPEPEPKPEPWPSFVDVPMGPGTSPANPDTAPDPDDQGDEPGLGGGNPYPWGECTWYAKERRPDVGAWGNAASWLGRAQAAGFPTGNVPVHGALAVWGANMGGAHAAGHVAFVESANPGNNRITVSDSNWVARHTVSTNRVVSISGIIGYIYGGPAGNGPQAGPMPFNSSLDAQILPSAISPDGTPQTVGYNVRFNRRFDAGNFVLRPDGVTTPDINHFLRIPGGHPGSGDWPGAMPSNDDHVGYYRASVVATPGTAQGHYFLRWNVVHKGTGQFGGLQPSTWVTVGNPPYGTPPKLAVGYDAVFVDQQHPRILAPGEEGSVTIKLRNTGSKFWGADVRLATPDDSVVRNATAGIHNGNRVPWSSDQDDNGSVSPGEVATFTYKIQGPADQAQAYRQRFTLVKDGIDNGRFGHHIGLYIPTVIADADHFPPLPASECGWSWVTQGGSPLEPNGALTATGTQSSSFYFKIKNESDICPWFPTGDAPLRLATASPLDRLSGFADFSNGWVTKNRVALPHAVPPQGVVTIPFGIKADPGVPAGLYREYMSPVMEGRFHMGNAPGMHVLVNRK